MSFGTIIAPSGSYTERAKGTYVNADLVFGGPANEFRLRPNSNSKQPSATVTRVQQADVTMTSGQIQRLAASVQISIQVPSNGFTAAQIVALVGDLNAFCTATNITALLQGKS